MGYTALLGNERLKENIRRSVASGRTAHFYLITGPKGSGKHTLAKFLAAALLCEGKEKPCLSCSHCRKVMDNAHPDFITVNDPEHKTLPIDIIRDVRDDMFVRPNEAAKKIYMIDQEMRVEGQNALLKVLEEPPAYGVFFLLAENPNSLLPTVRSRCIQLSLTALPESLMQRELRARFPQASAEDLSAAVLRSGGYLGQALELLGEGAGDAPQTLLFAEGFAKKDPATLLKALVPMEKWKRDQVIPVLEQWLALTQSALVCRSGMASPSESARLISRSRSSRELMDAISALQTAILYTKGNVSVAAVCGWLEHALQ